MISWIFLLFLMLLLLTKHHIDLITLIVVANIVTFLIINILIAITIINNIQLNEINHPFSKQELILIHIYRLYSN